VQDDLAFSRRKLLQGGALVVGFAMLSVMRNLARSTGGAAKPAAVTEVDSFIAINPEGRAIIYSGKVDIGTGPRMAFTQSAAEELNLPMESVSMIQGDTLLTPDQGPTSGSFSIQNGGMQLRRAAAAAMDALREQAAARLRVWKDAVKSADGVLFAPGGRSVTYGQVIGGKAFSITLDPKKPASTKSPANFSLVGSAPRQNIAYRFFGHAGRTQGSGRSLSAVAIGRKSVSGRLAKGEKPSLR
jgi:nicotinate dehydrogenase subunit B